MSLFMLHRSLVAIAFGLAAYTAACTDARTERELAIEATALVESGQVQAGVMLFEQALQRYPDSAELRLRLASHLVNEGSLAQAALLIEQADALPMQDDQRARRDQLAIRWLEQSRDRAAGLVSGVGADPDAYGQFIRELVERRGDPADREALSHHLLQSARAAVGRNPETPLTPEIIGIPDLAPVEDARAAMILLDQLFDPQALLGGQPELSEALLQEARALRTRLRHIVQGAEFDERFARLHRPTLVDAGQFDLAQSRFRLQYEGPPPVTFPETFDPELVEQTCQYAVARNMAVEQAHQLADAPAEIDNRDETPLAFDLNDFADVEVLQSSMSTDGLLLCRLTIPWNTVRRAGLLLEDRWRPPVGD
jgi:hypothetical protein